jgi:hypothetical protein
MTTEDGLLSTLVDSDSLESHSFTCPGRIVGERLRVSVPTHDPLKPYKRVWGVLVALTGPHTGSTLLVDGRIEDGSGSFSITISNPVFHG